ncbi:hypothetical protein FBUS_08147 [Fasciolopsis buskii]|uniref:Tetraspanin n=1 Tax=Fasciolopsis buskii TaxID=27845 RepID=A0A8E0RKQ0_9TREM|nr:hypothetical protein FBUS_08147 [Fasciolopsis buski]
MLRYNKIYFIPLPISISAHPTYSKKPIDPPPNKKESWLEFPRFSKEIHGAMCRRFCRLFLIVFNMLALLISLVLLIIGPILIWGREIVRSSIEDKLSPLMQALATDEQDELLLADQVLAATNTIGSLLLVTGAITTLCSILGFVGAYVKNRNLLTIYCIMVFIMDLVTMISFAVYFHNRDAFAQKAVTFYENHVIKYRSMEARTIDTVFVALVSQHFACCGANGENEFVNLQSTDVYKEKNYTGLKYPLPCCIMNSAYEIVGSDCPKTFTVNNSYVQSSCSEPIKQVFIKYMNYAATGLVILFLMLIVVTAFTMLTIQSLNSRTW